MDSADNGQVFAFEFRMARDKKIPAQLLIVHMQAQY